MKKLIMIAVMGGVLAGCSTEASRMNDCGNKGVSREACYVAEQNRQATINAAAEKQAMENAQNLYITNDGNSSYHHNHNKY
ncbi:hypothetical protein FDX24_06510 [Citrobacter sp. wls716]|uniref:hypothetical protein n=1 Tax=Citrobacter sp. wls716 TaxID=2576420 RepID=UPI0010C938BF|nr:hypothetical protein [Citrobacter sp. wls716]TKU42621.1 hypothetical protein FDX24_06510 [Citrobacter sp. wls716]